MGQEGFEEYLETISDDKGNEMSQEKHDLGREYYKKVYANTLPEMPERGIRFFDYMLETLLALYGLMRKVSPFVIVD